MRILKKIAIILSIVLIWSAFIGYGFVEGFLLKPMTSEETPSAFIAASKEKIATQYVGNLAMAIIENGKVAETHFHSATSHQISIHSAFPVASISKWVTAFGVLQLVEKGMLDLDKPVDDYLTRWHLPASEFDNKEVTVRRLLSHSAGLIDDLGYDGFSKDEEVQTLEASLDKAADGYYSEGAARVGYQPGSQYMYSGASYTLLQLLIEEVSGESFQEYMVNKVLLPLGMKNSSYELADSSRIGLVPVFRNDSSKRPMNRFTAKAAASLMTSVSDLSNFMLAHINNNTLLSSKIIQQMSEPTSFRNGTAYCGLGPHLYSQERADSKIIGHDGSGNNAINSAARLDLMSNSGIIVLETGNFSMASELADEWMYWKTGVADRVVMQRNIPYLLTVLAIGYILIIGSSVMIFKRQNQKL